MPKVAYSEAERRRIREALLAAAQALMARQGVQHTTVEQVYKQVGISRTFFYSYFPTKEDLILEVFHRQQPALVEHARRLMADPAVSWREGVKKFLRDCCCSESRFAIMTVEEQQALYKCISAENYKAVQQGQVQVFTEILQVFGLSPQPAAAKLIGNLSLAMVVVRKAIPGSLPFLFAEAADAMVDFQINALVDYMETLRATAPAP